MISRRRLEACQLSPYTSIKQGSCVSVACFVLLSIYLGRLIKHITMKLPSLALGLVALPGAFAWGGMTTPIQCRRLMPP